MGKVNKQAVSMNALVRQELSRWIITLLLQEPFYAHLLSGVRRLISTDCDTAAVSMRDHVITLHINPGFFMHELKNDSERIAVLKHEVLHLVFKHLCRGRPADYDAELFNIAADLVVNQYIGKWQLPASAVTLESFPELRLPVNKSLEYYYAELSSLSSDARKQVRRQATSIDHSAWDGGEASAANSSEMSGQVSELQVDKLLIQAAERTCSSKWGILPATILRILEKAVASAKPQVDWRHSLRMFASGSTRTRLQRTMKRVSKRYGTRPGIKIRVQQQLLVAVDTSGSISAELLDAFFAEIHAIWRTGVEVDVIECDAEVQALYTYKGTRPEVVAGGGGTAFDPVFEYMRTHKRSRYTGCIYLTDGYAPEPKVRPTCRIIWVVSPDGSSENLKFGRVIQLGERCG